MSTYRIGDGKEEISVLSGDLEVTDPILTLNSRDTIRLEGLGEALTGLYYVDEVQISIEGNGNLKQSLKVTRNGFEDYIKVHDVAVKNKRNVQSSQVIPTNISKQHVVVSGETIWSIASKYYGDSSYYSLIYDINKSKISNINRLPVGTVLTIPLEV